MKKIFVILLILISLKTISQNNDVVDLSKIKFCELTIDNLKEQDANLKEVELEEMDLCSDGFVQDRRFENRIGYESKFYPGVIFQKYQSDDNVIAKIHLKREFKGYLPDGSYIDISILKAKDVLDKNSQLQRNVRDCSNYLSLHNDSIYYYVSLDKTKPKYPVAEKQYSDKPIQAIDIISDCYSFNEKTKINPLYIVEGKEANEEFIRDLKPEDVDSITVLKDKSAVDKYGEKGKNGVLEIKLKKK